MSQRMKERTSWNKGKKLGAPWNKGRSYQLYSDKDKVRRGTGKFITCDTCGKEQFRNNNAIKPHNFCNRECYVAFRKGQDLGGWIEHVCTQCCTVFKRQRYLDSPKQLGVFCDNKCYQDYKAIYGNTPFTIGKTKPEQKVEDILKKVNIEYIYNRVVEHPEFGRCYYDFFIPSKNTVIEVDGDYWHGNPKYYPQLNDQQIGVRIRDLQKEEVLKESNIRLIRVWESEIDFVSLISKINNN